MNTSNLRANPLQFPAFLILMSVAALALAAMQWLLAKVRRPGQQAAVQPVSREFAERFGSWGRIPHQQ
jgi:hypothetical protein